MRLAILATVTAAAVTLLVPSVSQASPYIRYGVQDDAYLSAGPALPSRLDTLDRLGAQLVRFTVNWRQIAAHKPKRATNPNDPAYDWSNADAVLNGLHRGRDAGGVGRLRLVRVLGQPDPLRAEVAPDLVQQHRQVRQGEHP
ncbi:MAG TPA: hypothetical protein VE055_06815, partial [Gaiellaceae bacterium]|nr:hypothetical protein [Gaiellaceae bacterium]